MLYKRIPACFYTKNWQDSIIFSRVKYLSSYVYQTFYFNHESATPYVSQRLCFAHHYQSLFELSCIFQCDTRYISGYFSTQSFAQQ